MMKRNEPKRNPVGGGGWRWVPLAASAALALLATLLTTQAQSGYSLTGLGFLSGGTDSIAYAISGDGTTVVGQSSSTLGTAEAFKWMSVGMLPLGDLSGGSFVSVAYGVNSDGSTIVGSGTTTTSTGTDLTQAFSYTSSGGMVSLGAWVVDKPDTAFAVDGSGVSKVIVGEASNGSWTRGISIIDGSFTDLGDLTGLNAGNTSAKAVTKGGLGGNNVIVGSSMALLTSGLKVRAFRKVGNATMQDLGTLGGETARANDVSQDGTIVVGASAHTRTDVGFVDEAFVWDSSSGTMTGLGDVLPNGSDAEFNSEAFGISADGQVIVGRGKTGAGSNDTDYGAFVYFQSTGTMELLSTVLGSAFTDSGWQQLTKAYGVSDDGTKIVGVGLNATGGTEAFLATIAVPVPEPQTYGLVAGGMLLGLAVWHRRLGGRRSAEP